MDNTNWILKRIHYIESLDTPSNVQKKILELYHSSTRTLQENRQLDSLLKLERIHERSDSKKNGTLPKTADIQKKIQRRGRSMELHELGAIVRLLNFDFDKGLLAGSLLYVMDQLREEDGDELKMRLKLRGDKLLQAQEQAKQSKRKQKNDL